jgi:ABC-type phosphate transport system substrate-binding protein
VKRRRGARKLGLGLAGLSLASLATAGLSLTATTGAWADYAPQPGDIVGVGGDTPQFALDFVANGDYNGDLGFNASGAYNRLVTFDATPDGNGRSAYTNSVTTGVASVALNPTDVLRAGTFPVQRISSSGSAITALLADTNTPEEIDFVFSASEPTSAQQSAASKWGYLHVVEIGTDTIGIAVDSTATNAPAGLSAAELLDIYTGVYTKWDQLPGNSSGSADTIIPEIPPSGSSIYKTFLNDLTAANGGTTPTLVGTKQVEQNDPTAITTATNSADAIVPFSAARLALWNDGYFHNPSSAFPGGAVLTPGVKIISGVAPDGTASYASPITDYVIFRESDATITTPMEPGGKLNWVQTLFSNPGGVDPFVERSGGQALIQSSGVTPNYQDLGNVSSG